MCLWLAFVLRIYHILITKEKINDMVGTAIPVTGQVAIRYHQYQSTGL
jgi:hypothetical protein